MFVEFSVCCVFGEFFDEDIVIRLASEIVGFAIVPGDSDCFLAEFRVVEFVDGFLSYYG